MADNNKFQEEIVNTLINNLNSLSTDLLQQLESKIKEELSARESGDEDLDLKIQECYWCSILGPKYSRE